MVAPLKPWFQTPAGLVRIQSDRRLLAAIATLLPHPRLRCGKFALKIQFDVILSANVAQRIILEIVFPSKYPLRAPSAFILGKAFAPRDRTRHFMDDGSCCLFLPGVDEAWDSSISSALDPWLDQVLLFIARQMIFDHLGRWPGDEWEHGFAAYSQHVSETVGNELAAAFYEHRKKAISPFALCPCGSTETFSKLSSN